MLLFAVVFLAKLNISAKNNNLVFSQLQNPSLVAGFVVPVNLGLQLGANVHFEAKKEKEKGGGERRIYAGAALELF